VTLKSEAYYKSVEVAWEQRFSTSPVTRTVVSFPVAPPPQEHKRTEPLVVETYREKDRRQGKLMRLPCPITGDRHHLMKNGQGRLKCLRCGRTGPQKVEAS
jgi:hypothetical protein